MRIVIISDDGLPDIRVEREIYLLRKMEHDVYFIGPFHYTSLIDKSYLSGIYNIDFPIKAKLDIPPYSYWIKRKINKILRAVKPDMIIAVNFYMANIIHKLGYPMIFDDHEFNQLLISFRYVTNEYQDFQSRISALRSLYLMRKNLYEIVAENTTWVVSEYFKNVYKAVTGNNHIYVLRNYPTLKELNSIEFKELGKPPLNMCFFGSLSLTNIKSLIRRVYESINTLINMQEFGSSMYLHVFGGKINYLQEKRGIVYHGYIRNVIDLLKQLSRMHACLIAYLPTPIQAPYSPNKVYHCMAAGGIPIITDTMIEVIKEIENGLLLVNSIDFEKSLSQIIKNLTNMSSEEINSMRLKAYMTIRSHSWEHYENIISRSLSY